MLRCKQVAEALADHRYWKLPRHRRIGLKLHVLLCFVCGRYHRHVMVMQWAAHDFAAHEQSYAPGEGPALSAEARARIAEKMRIER